MIYINTSTPGAISLKLHLVVISFVVCLSISGCAQLGPDAMRASRLNYNEAVQISDQRELLLNLVRLRYTEAPEFLEISGISTQMNFEAGASIGGDFGEVEDANSAFLAPGASVGYSESPTITFIPRRDQEFTRQLVAPIELDSIYLLTHYGWGVDRVLLLIASEINGIDNTTNRETAKFNHSQRESFTEIFTSLRLLQTKGLVHVGVQSRGEMILAHIPQDSVSVDDILKIANEGFLLEEKQGQNGYALKEITNHYIMEIDQQAWDLSELKTLSTILQIEPGQRSYEIDPIGNTKENNIHLSTRSVLGVMAYLSDAVIIPDEHANLVMSSAPPNHLVQNIMRINVSKTYQDDMHLAVTYRDHWFYISDQDLESKRTLGLLTSLIRLSISAGGAQNVPVLTLPVSKR